jgi:hypothetical protein
MKSLSRLLTLIRRAAFVVAISSAASAAADVAIVSRPDLPVEDLVRAPVARERDIVLRTIYRMTEAQFRQYWIAKVFRAEAATGPKVVYSSEMATELVSAIPGAVTFVDAAQVPKDLKVIRIDGKLPGEKGYPLR